MIATDRQAWLAARRGSIGSSDAAPVCGLSRFRTQLHVWADKVLGVVPKTGLDEENLRRRERAEPFIAGEWEHETGESLLTPGVSPGLPAKIFVHPEYPWMAASPDRIVAGRRKGVELKTADSPYDGWGPVGSQVVPPQYFVQVQHQMACTGFPEWDVAVVFGRGWDFRIYTIPRSDRFIEQLVEIEQAFWAWVVCRVPPPADWSHADTPALVAAIPTELPPAEIELDGEAAVVARSLDQVRRELSRLDKLKDEYRTQLFAAIGRPGVGRFPGGSATWKRTKNANLLTVELEGESHGD